MSSARAGTMVTDGAPDKETIRQKGLDRRRALGDDRRRRASQAVVDRLEAWELTAGAHRLAGYIASDNEVELDGFLEWRLRVGRDVVLPRVLDDTDMEFAAIEDLDSLVTGAFGIPEPTGREVPIERIDVFLVPGTAFDRRGGRIGRGAGYYDRALGGRLDAESDVGFVGVAYDAQVWETPLPVESHDVRMDALVTENELHVVSGGRLADEES